MKLSILALSLSSILSSCTLFDLEEQGAENTENVVTENDAQSSYLESSTPLESSVSFQQQFRNKFANTEMKKNSDNAMPIVKTTNPEQDSNIQQSSHEPNPTHQHIQNKPLSGASLNINHYAKGLMQDLVANLQLVDSTTPLAVVSFVMLDGDYNESNIMGIQLAESLIHETHKFGIPVIDYKTTGYIRITEQGDFAFSKDYEELGGSLAAEYVIGGTMTKHIDGYLINARVISLESKTVVASAQNFIPNRISNALLSKSSEMVSVAKQPKRSGSEKIIEKPQKEKMMNHTVSLISK